VCKVISAISYKGGVGKTTSAVNISSYLQMQGKRVCTVDLDPQHLVFLCMSMLLELRRQRLTHRSPRR